MPCVCHWDTSFCKVPWFFPRELTFRLCQPWSIWSGKVFPWFLSRVPLSIKTVLGIKLKHWVLNLHCVSKSPWVTFQTQILALSPPQDYEVAGLSRARKATSFWAHQGILKLRTIKPDVHLARWLLITEWEDGGTGLSREGGRRESSRDVVNQGQCVPSREGSHFLAPNRGKLEQRQPDGARPPNLSRDARTAVF